MAELKIGDRAPSFSAIDSDGEVIELAKVLVDRPVVLVFFPKAFTPG